MTDRETIKSLIEQAYEARRRGDLEPLVAVFHPDASFTIVGDNKLTAAAGRVKGHAALRQTLAGLIAGFEFLQRDIINLVVEGDRCACHSRVKLRYVPTNRTVTTDILDLCKFDNGKIAEFTEFVDTALVNDLAR